jgi:hypothetical protein
MTVPLLKNRARGDRQTRIHPKTNIKIIFTIVALAMAASPVHAQGGLLSWQNAVARPETNSAPYVPGYPNTAGFPHGITSGSAAGLYYFILLEATSTTAADYGNPLGPDWNVVTYESGGIAYGTNFVIAGSVTGFDGVSGFASDLSVGVTYDDMVVGWSASFATSWPQALAEIQGGVGSQSGFVGYSNMGTITPTPAPANGASIFGGTGALPHETILYGTLPEPATLALAGLGGLSMLVLHRRKA